VGVDIIGIGADFDGIEETPTDIQGPQDYDKIINALLQLNYSEGDVRKIAFENYKRLINEVL
ncbi:MAG: membrane dipeptidase, partial [Clostridiales bacterium]|nr:membrane dipeptidase [Clostridiales bacterium]